MKPVSLWRRRLVRPALHRAGISWTALRDGSGVIGRRGQRPQVQPIAADAWLVQLPDDPANPLTVEDVDRRTWVLQRRRGRRRRVTQIGPNVLRTHLLVDQGAARDRMRGHQRHIGNYLSTEHIAWMLRELRVNCVLDVGGNIGEYGQLLREMGYTGRIVSFEPLAHLADRLREAAADDPDWQVVQSALGAGEGEAGMTVVGGRGSTSSLLPVSDFGKTWSPRLEGVDEEQVTVRRLEDLFDDAIAGLDSPRVYLKLDTQGYDLQAFRGAGRRIDEVVGMQSEIANVPIYDGMPRMTEQIAAYEKEGFETTGMFPVTIDRTTHRVIEFDVVMIRADALPNPEN